MKEGDEADAEVAKQPEAHHVAPRPGAQPALRAGLAGGRRARRGGASTRACATTPTRRWRCWPIWWAPPIEKLRELAKRLAGEAVPRHRPPRSGAAAGHRHARASCRIGPTAATSTSTPAWRRSSRAARGAHRRRAPAGARLGEAERRRCACWWTAAARWAASRWPPRRWPRRPWPTVRQQDYSVLAFGKNVVVAKGQQTPKPSDLVVNDVLSLRGFGTTDLAGALRVAGEQLARSRAGRKVTVVLSDCRVHGRRRPGGRGGRRWASWWSSPRRATATRRRPSPPESVPAASPSAAPARWPKRSPEPSTAPPESPSGCGVRSADDVGVGEDVALAVLLGFDDGRGGGAAHGGGRRGRWPVPPVEVEPGTVVVVAVAVVVVSNTCSGAPASGAWPWKMARMRLHVVAVDASARARRCR